MLCSRIGIFLICDILKELKLKFKKKKKIVKKSKIILIKEKKIVKKSKIILIKDVFKNEYFL